MADKNKTKKKKSDKDVLEQEKTSDAPETEEKKEKEEQDIVQEKEAETVEDEHSEDEAETAKEETADKEPVSSKKKDKRTAKLEEQLADLEDKRVRQLAEFENFRKRSEKEKSQMFEMGSKNVVEKILPVMDNFERGLTAVPEEDKESPFVQGIELVYKQMLTAFEELGVTPIEAVGQEFDPNLHNAVMMVDDDELESGMVAEELQKGYLYKDNVVRHSMVKVVN
ncbi:MAG: nucleotide exchange factor GrpE [Lachnospiraceae bacterium]|nr:nucleotide exchange factor GrpE [Lachnospiraceae bacterium]